MSAADTLARLGLDDPDDAFCADLWPASRAVRPAGVPRFLEEAAIRRDRAFAGLPPPVDGPLLAAAARVRASAALTDLAWHAQYLLYDVADFAAHQKTRQWPARIAALDGGASGDLTAAFYLLLGLEAIPRMLAVHAARAVPRDISAACCSHYPASLQRFADHHQGRVGVRPGTLYWLRNHVRGDLYRLGRLEYMVKPFAGRFVAWRQRTTRAVVALAADGVPFDDEGIVAAEAAGARWTARLEETADTVTGVPIDPRGHALPGPVTLRLADWEPVLRAGDPILEVHIPAGGDMTPAACRASMQQALAFFPRTFPEKPFVGFACGSWILNPQLDRVYRPDSNMVRWQRELYLFPLPNRPDSRSGLYFVFGTDDVDPATAPRDTSLRRALLDHLGAGGRLLGGGMFLLLEEFARFGEQPYRAQWAGGPPLEA